MKGLIKKDFYLITARKETLLMLLACAVFMSFSMDGTFLLTYIPMIAMILGIGTISYDEYDNGYPFLFSLPVDSKTYVKAKFAFCYILQFAGLILGFVLMMILNATGIKPTDMSDAFEFVVASFGIMMVASAVMLYVQLRFGSERSRFIMMLIYGICALIAVVAVKFGDKLAPVGMAIDQFLGSVSTVIVAAGLILACLGICYLFYSMTVRMMDKKEF